MSVEQELVDQQKPDAGVDSEKEEEKQPVQPFMYYLKPEVMFKIVTTRWGIITIIAGACYLVEIIWTISGVNNYTDITRNTLCGSIKTSFDAAPKGTAKEVAAALAVAQAASSAVYDTPILLVTYWHMIEWIRWTVLLTTALVDANLIYFFYVLCLAIPYGFVMSVVVFIMRQGGDLAACADAQPERARYLQLQLVAFFLYFIVSCANIWLLKIKGVDWCHEQWLADEDEEDD